MILFSINVVHIKQTLFSVLNNVWQFTTHTVKLGYIELGYNEHSVITNKKFSPKWPFYNIKQPGYNKTRL